MQSNWKAFGIPLLARRRIDNKHVEDKICSIMTDVLNFTIGAYNMPMQTTWLDHYLKMEGFNDFEKLEVLPLSAILENKFAYITYGFLKEEYNLVFPGKFPASRIWLPADLDVEKLECVLEKLWDFSRWSKQKRWNYLDYIFRKYYYKVGKWKV
jgi:hypothetical protein